MRILVTGVTGFVGRAVALSLVNNGHEVIGLVRNSKKATAIEAFGIEPLMADISNEKRLTLAVSRVDGVFHGAAANTSSWNEINREVILTILEAFSRTSKPFVMQSGAMVFGDTGTQPLLNRELVIKPPTFLSDRAKLEKLVLRIGDVRSSIVYASYVYGGPGAVIPGVLTRAAKELGVSYYPGLGTNKWSTIHISDWANLITKVLESPNSKGMYVASNEIFSTKSIAEIIAHNLNLPGEVQSIDIEGFRDLWGPFTMPLANYNQAFAADRAKYELNWKPLYKMNQPISA